MSKALQITNLSKTYGNGFTALKGVSLSVEKGDFFALLGANGAGKSTMIGIISSLVNKTSGEVNIHGFDLDTQRSEAKAMIGLVPQEFNFNVFEPVEEILLNQAGYYGVGRSEAKVRAKQLLEQLELWDKRKNMASELSGGMKRRLMIARALIHRPQLLILDEPTAGVDIEIRRSMWDFLKKLNEAGITIILTTHYLEEAENLCRNIAIINKGDIVENTSMKALLSHLQTETFILDLKEPLDALPETDEFILRQIDASTLEVELNKDHSINRIFEVLNTHGIRVSSLRNKTNRLEELFIELVQQSNHDTTQEVSA
ncbi:ABC transporter ATP-binding protein [Leucothrix pacifica]|uniref:ABC transporter n=1 Tax=Leucothrix pacifica TaxID=1247513 RepID=A0A317CFZ7_9GAMM|nr:ABC transporter ATP-binding protein [Leucothrix pacifica]PWQ97446.1 ABC transporter [Leucothrix pacifica]